MDVSDSRPGGTVVELPELTGPIAAAHGGSGSRPFLAAQPRFDLTADDYVEQEFLLSGQACVYGWRTGPALGRLGDGGYLTRVLVRRPRRALRFSGNVWVELLNPTFGYDVDFVWGLSHRHFMRTGDAWVGVTIKPIALAALRAFDSRRYAGIGMPDPRFRELPPAHGRTRAEASGEAGLAWDMIAQLGALLRAGGSRSPLSGWPIRCLGLTGYSQSAAYALVYMSTIAGRACRFGGGPIFDAYLPIAGSYAGIPINGREQPPPAGDRRSRLRAAAGTVAIVVSTQADFFTATTWERRTHRPADRDHDGAIRLYEVAGAGHLSQQMIRTLPAARDVIAAGCTPFGGWLYPPSDFPLHYIVNGAFANLADWVRHATYPPRAGRLRPANPTSWPVDAKADALGNALGGVRSPSLDVPIATYLARTPGPGHVGLMVGHKLDFAPEFTRTLYGSHAGYLDRVATRTEQLRQSRWLTTPDSKEIIAHAQQHQTSL